MPNGGSIHACSRNLEVLCVPESGLQIAAVRVPQPRLEMTAANVRSQRILASLYYMLRDLTA